MNKRARAAKFLSGICSFLGLMLVAYTTTIGLTFAQSPVTAPSNTSRTGVQSVLTQNRDSIQRSAASDRRQSRRDQAVVKNPNVR